MFIILSLTLAIIALNYKKILFLIRNDKIDTNLLFSSHGYREQFFQSIEKTNNYISTSHYIPAYVEYNNIKQKIEIFGHKDNQLYSFGHETGMLEIIDIKDIDYLVDTHFNIFEKNQTSNFLNQLKRKYT
jgi:hypothetical protein